ncbi:hypothetical protein [Haliea sp.]|uniref:hypothetical protein n=1 Tax=Haliea sp. TaxID=1932666 RepID=UPI0035283B53
MQSGCNHLWVRGCSAFRRGAAAACLGIAALHAQTVCAAEEDTLSAAFEDFQRALQQAESDVRSSPAFGSDAERAAGYQHMLRMLLKSIEAGMLQDARYPFFRVMDMHVREGGDNPDQRYLFAPVEGGAAYRIHGELGSASRIEVQLYAGEPWAGAGRSAGYLGFEAIPIDAEGRFEVYLEPPGAAPRPGALSNPEDTTTVVVRQIYADWTQDAPGHVHIDRTGMEGDVRLPDTGAEVAARLRETARILEQSVAVWPAFVEQRYRQVREANVLSPPLDTSTLGGVKGRWMVSGHFDIPPGHALLLRTTPTSARYQALQITDLWFASLEYANGTASFTRSQSTLASDGAYYHVIAAQDPGYPNWLGTGGLQRGTVLLRYDGMTTALAEDDWPQATLLKLEELPAAIPGFFVLSAAERAEQVRARRAHVQRRFSR